MNKIKPFFTSEQAASFAARIGCGSGKSNTGRIESTDNLNDTPFNGFELTEEDFDFLFDGYSLYVENIVRLKGGHSNINYKVELTNGSHVIVNVLESFDKNTKNVVRRGQKRNPVEHHLMAMNHIARYDWAPEAPLYHTIFGEGSPEQIIFLYGKPIIVKPYVEGATQRYWENNQLFDVGATLANVHLIEPIASLGEVDLTIPSDWKERTITPPKAIQDLVDKNRRFLFDHRIGDLPKGFIHGDFLGSNVVRTHEGRYIIIDWEDASKDYILFDLALAMGGSTRTKERYDLFLEGYESVRPLNELERTLLDPAIDYMRSIIALWRFWNETGYPGREIKLDYRDMLN